MSGTGLLIVNADDWGHDGRTTGAIAECFEAGGLTSTTAMMFMEGSERAAARASELPGLAIGLHLNLYEEYTDPQVPAPVRERQHRLVSYFRRSRLRRWIYDPRIRRETNRIVADQFDRFQELYGRPPTHMDGHHHSHLAANVLLSRSVPAGTKIRNAQSNTERRSLLTNALRAVRGAAIGRRYSSTDYFLSILTVWPDLRGEPLPDQLGLSKQASVEVMVHPGFPEEFAVLRSPTWTDAIHNYPLGSFADL